MDHLIGIVGDGYALVAADRKVAHSIIAVKHDEDKILPLDQSKLLGCVGELGDTKNFSEFIQKNMALYALRNGTELSTHAAAHFIRGEIAHALRSSPKLCNMVLVGYDKDEGPSLFHMDYLGGMHKMNFGGHGYGSFFAVSLLDRLWRPNMSLEEGIELMKKVFAEINTRFLVGGSTFTLKIVDKDGTRTINLDDNMTA
eukprot:CAMPEP_0196717016 /NCGR_PEP_ID=MMETSP1091-20130531/445_1 /TAXON_ID=302021 /ORGANISM="Rhodomonas sp., Strain CCMP768" /LENGTH=198 /DNA_ID=CAMNT_0042057231 /DNA_START=52 /DNA_END=648 /DNA_ORIENTATION=+